jgi:hypothetical protein
MAIEAAAGVAISSFDLFESEALFHNKLTLARAF